MTSQNYEYLLKILLVGDTAVGKTSLFNKYITNKFKTDTASTVGVEFTTKNVILEVNEQEVNIKLQLWDTAGQERYRSMTHAYYRGAAGALLVYDITNSESFQQCEQWINEIQERSGPDCQLILVGNKKDLEDQRQVQVEEGLNLSQRKNTLFIETSAQEGQNVHEAFETLMRKIVDEKSKHKEAEEEFKPQRVVVLQEEQHQDGRKDRRGCC